MKVLLRDCGSHFFQFPAIKDGKEFIVTAIRSANVKDDCSEFIGCIDVYTGKRFHLHPDANVDEVVFADFRTE